MIQKIVLVAQLCLTLCYPTDCSPPGSSVHGDSPGKNNGVGCHFLLQGIFLTQGIFVIRKGDIYSTLCSSEMKEAECEPNSDSKGHVFSTTSLFNRHKLEGSPLVVQWLRIRLVMQGTRLNPCLGN